MIFALVPEIDFFNARSILLFVCLLQGLIFSFILAVRGFKNKTRSDYLLAILLVLMCSSLITHFIGFANVYDNNQWLSFFPFEPLFAFSPTIYIYARFLTNSKERFAPRFWLFYLPSVAYLAYSLFLFFQTLEFKDWFIDWANANYWFAFFDAALSAWNFGFLAMAFARYRKYRSWLNQNYSDTEKVKFDWLRNFLVMIAVLFVAEFVFNTLNVLFDLSYVQYYYLKITTAFATYYLAISGFVRSREMVVEFESIAEEPSPEQNEGALEADKSRLLELMSTERPFLDPQLTLRDLAGLMAFNTSRVSHVINKGIGINFNDFVNGYRIDEVKRKLADADAKDSNILSIAFECGFNSKATFNRAFKKSTGVTPIQFLNENKSARP
ncbi:MAG: AraC family transcriptional regulator [Pyrinomonadaceae bacterium]